MSHDAEFRPGSGVTEPVEAAEPPEQPDPWVGRTLGKYRIVECLGRGGMGVVYEAEDEMLQRRVAIKVLHPSVAEQEISLKRFLMEARAAARLNHPNVVAIHEVDLDQGVNYLVMELIRGSSAQSRLETQGAFPCDDATRIITEVCRGLAAAHAAGLVHRDINPANVMISDDGTAKLADFGLARRLESPEETFSRPGVVRGTAEYMCPEQCRGERADIRGDVYSLAATYFALLTGNPPYMDGTPMDIMSAHCEAPVPDPRERIPVLPEHTVNVIQRAMAKHPDDRYASAGEMLRDLECPDVSAATLRSVEHAAMPAKPPRPITGKLPVPTIELEPPRRRPPLWVAFTAGFAAAAAGMVGALWWTTKRDPAPPAPIVETKVDPRPAPPVPTPPEKAKTKVEPEADPPVAVKKEPPKPPPAPVRGEAIELKGHTAGVEGLAFSPDGKFLATVSGDDRVRGELVVWNLETNEPAYTMRDDTAGAHCVAYSPDGKFLAVGLHDRTVKVRDASDGKVIRVLADHHDRVNTVAFSPDGRTLAAGSGDYKKSGEIRLWNLDNADDPPTVLKGHKNPLRCVMWYSSERLWSLAGEMTRAAEIKIWDIAERREIDGWSPVGGDAYNMALSTDGKFFVVGTSPRRGVGEVHIFEPPLREQFRVLAGFTDLVRSVTFSADNNFLAGASWDGTVRIWRAGGEPVDMFKAHSDRVRGVAFAPDGKCLATIGRDKIVRLWPLTYTPSGE